MSKSKSLRTYSVPYVEDLVESRSSSVESIDDPDLSLINHLAMYFGRDLRATLRSTMRQRKRSYDAEGESYKTPYALRNVKDKLERAILLSSISAFSTTQGCTGGCARCGYDALLTNDIEVIPLEQKLNFYDELVSVISETEPSLLPVIIRQIMQFHDSNSFDDPDVVHVARHVYRLAGAVPQLSNNSSSVGMGNLMYLAQSSEKHRLREALSELIAYLNRNFFGSRTMNPRIHGRYDPVLEALGLNDLTHYLGLGNDECIRQLQGEYDKIHTSLGDDPYASLIRLSVVKHRPDISATLPPSVGITHKSGPSAQFPMIEGGKDFYLSGTLLGGFGISCKSGMVVTPFGVFSSVPGLKTHEYPQARVFAPYRGLSADPLLFPPDTNLEAVIDKLIVIDRPASRVPGNATICVFDGLRRIRTITYDQARYTVVSDTVLHEEVDSPKSILQMRGSYSLKNSLNGSLATL